MALFKKILIANRGEIAVRIIRTAKKLGISTVAVYSEDESNALHVRMADEAWGLKGTSLTGTYLDAGKIISIAKKAGASAIHPGYGFLSENEKFAGACENAGITFIGPLSDSIAIMGNKTRAKETALIAGLPVIEGYTGKVEELLSKGKKMIFPVLVKAAAGGGGKGMRIVYTPENLGEAIEATAREAETYFGNGSVYLEQYIESPRHIEIQILGDNHGNIIHLFERECSIQRRYQKIIEESPSPFTSRIIREKMGSAAVKLAREIDYRNAGTIEFLADKAGNFYFLEMNTRIQVEHPVTEAVTGIDIVEEQIYIASGQKLRYSQDQVKINGHAIECRIYSEDPAADFIPCPGKMTCYHEPRGEGIRIDSAYDRESEVSGNYDPMISKLITTGKDREDVRKKMISALGNYGIHGIKTNTAFLLSLLQNKDFIRSEISTTYCEENRQKILEDQEKSKTENTWKIPAIAAFIASTKRKTGNNALWNRLGYWRAGKTMKFCFEGETVEAVINILSDGNYNLTLNSEELSGKYRIENKILKIELRGDLRQVFISENNDGHFMITFGGHEYFFRRFDFLKKKDWFIPGEPDLTAGSGTVYSPMPGRVIKISKAEGENVKKGDVLMIVESMKMENSLKAPVSGIIENVKVKEGELIDGSLPLIQIKEDKSA